MAALNMPTFFVFILCLAFHEWIVRDAVVNAEDPDCKKQSQLAEAINGFGIAMYKRIESKDKGSNVFFSPISVSTALSMLLPGAGGQTKSEMEDVLGVSGIGNVESIYSNLNKKLYKKIKGTELRSANKLYNDQTLHVKSNFKNVLEQFYRGSIEELDFKDSTRATATINNWVASQTNQLIKEVLQPGDIDANTVFALVNAIYFKGGWVTQFHETETAIREFDTCTGKKVDVEMMYQEAPFKYYHDLVLQAQFLELPYVGDKFSMILILPDEKCGIDDVSSRLTFNNLKKTLDLLQNPVFAREVYVSLPKLKFKWRDELSKILDDMGIKKLFSATVNLDGFSEDERLDVSKIIHEAFVDINEKGTEAAAVTVIVGGRSGYVPPPVKVNCNRPFIFFIYDKECGVILFIGKVIEPVAVKSTKQAYKTDDDIGESLDSCREKCRQMCYEEVLGKYNYTLTGIDAGDECDVKECKTDCEIRCKHSKPRKNGGGNTKNIFKDDFKKLRVCRRRCNCAADPPMQGRSGLGCR